MFTDNAVQEIIQTNKNGEFAGRVKITLPSISGVVGVKLLGRQPDLMAPLPLQSYFFCLLVWEACHVVGTTCNRRSLRNRFGSMGATSPQHFYGRILVEVQEGSSPGSAKNLHFMGLKSGPNTAQKYVDGYIFHVHCSTKSQENPLGPKFLILKFLIRKNVFVL